MLTALAALLLLVQIDQPFPGVAWRYHVPTGVLLLASPWLLRRWPLSTASLGCLVFFLALHAIGGRWSYSFVPYDAMLHSLTGSTISDTFGFTRNHYDRLVHFSFGFLAILPVQEVVVRHLKASPRTATYIAFESVLAASALFEILEWLATITRMGPSVAGFNSWQGDIWDPQKDMLLAGLGALGMTAIHVSKGDYKLYNLSKSDELYRNDDPDRFIGG